MVLDRDILFSFIEEDNIQRAYFRVQPLLCVHGNVQEEAKKLWPDNGSLRIVPDRNEQHTFKDRMRSLGHWCVVDLTGYPADANKIRTNKNYRPDRDETNQFILYSDTVKAVPEHTFYEVLPGQPADFEPLCTQAITPLFYIREDDTLFGPVNKAAPSQPSPAQDLEGTLFDIPCPDEKTRTIFCVLSAAPAVQNDNADEAVQSPLPVPVSPLQPTAEPSTPAEEETALPIGRTLTILDQSKDFEETLQVLDQPLPESANLLRQEETPRPAAPAPKLSGTPLYRAPMRTFVPQPKNKLQEIVASQWRIARNDPPASPLPDGTAMRHVVNPVEAACQSMRAAWHVSEAQNQLIDFLLSLDGMRAKLELRLAESAGLTNLQRVMQARLQEIEAERLAALFQLDKAKEDLNTFRRSALAAQSEQDRAANKALADIKAEHEASIATLKTQLNQLIAQRDELTARVDSLRQSVLPAVLAKALADAQLAAPVSGIALRMTSISGKLTDPEEIIRRVSETHKACGLSAHRNDAIALLALLTICPRFALTSTTMASAATVAQNIAQRLGWEKSFAHQISLEQKPVADMIPADGTPAVLLTSLASYAPQERITKVFLARSSAMLTRNAAYESNSWPVYPLPALPFVNDLAAIPGEAPVSTSSLVAMAQRSGATDGELDQILNPILSSIPPLSGTAGRELRQFISVCSAWMDGGLVAACDWGILLWIIPMVEHSVKAIAAAKPLLEEYPLSMAQLLA